MNFLASEADVESVGGVSSAGQLHAQLRRRHAGELTRRLTEVCVLRWPDFSYSTNIKERMSATVFQKWQKVQKQHVGRQLSDKVFRSGQLRVGRHGRGRDCASSGALHWNRGETKSNIPPTISSGSSVISGAAWSAVRCTVAFSTLFITVTFVS